MKFIKEARENGTTKKVFVLSPENNIWVFAHLADARRTRPAGDLFFDSPAEFGHITAEFAGARLVAVWNKIPGVTPVQKFRDRATAVTRIWQAIQNLPPVCPSGEQAAAPTDTGARARFGTKKATVLALLGRPEGATVQEIMAALGWQPHSIRGYRTKRDARVDNSSAEMNNTVYSIAESPRNGQILWVGTDDGNVQLTRDGGKTWNNVGLAIPGRGQDPWISWVEASRFDEGTAYVTLDRHMYGDMNPHVYRTADFGKTWTTP